MVLATAPWFLIPGAQVGRFVVVLRLDRAGPAGEAGADDLEGTEDDLVGSDDEMAELERVGASDDPVLRALTAENLSFATATGSVDRANYRRGARSGSRDEHPRGPRCGLNSSTLLSISQAGFFSLDEEPVRVGHEWAFLIYAFVKSQEAGAVFLDGEVRDRPNDLA